tara:strand:- start:329 stop:544 length:216 start_codon:yes stop_codon:yes gene_type:complete
MAKFNFLILLIFILSHCSVDTKTGLWENINSEKDERKMSELNFNKELSFDDFKKNVVLYGKKSNYPNIMEK